MVETDSGTVISKSPIQPANAPLSMTLSAVSYTHLLKRIYDFYMSGVIDEALRVNHARREGKAEGYAEGEARGRAEGEARGRAEGEARGRAEGKAEGLLEAARNLKLEGLSAEKIAKITGLSIDKIENL